MINKKRVTAVLLSVLLSVGCLHSKEAIIAIKGARPDILFYVDTDFTDIEEGLSMFEELDLYCFLTPAREVLPDMRDAIEAFGCVYVKSTPVDGEEGLFSFWFFKDPKREGYYRSYTGPAID